MKPENRHQASKKAAFTVAKILCAITTIFLLWSCKENTEDPLFLTKNFPYPPNEGYFEGDYRIRFSTRTTVCLSKGSKPGVPDPAVTFSRRYWFFHLPISQFEEFRHLLREFENLVRISSDQKLAAGVEKPLAGIGWSAESAHALNEHFSEDYDAFDTYSVKFVTPDRLGFICQGKGNAGCDFSIRADEVNPILHLIDQLQSHRDKVIKQVQEVAAEHQREVEALNQ